MTPEPPDAVNETGPNASRKARIDWGFWIMLTLIVGTGTVLRLYGLGRESLWRDEAITARLAGQPFLVMLTNRAARCYPPLYFASIWQWVRLFGDSEFSLRLPSAISGILALPAICAVGSLLFRNRRVGLLAALLLASSQFNIRYSQEARWYATTTLLALGSTYWFIKILRQGTRWEWAGYLVSSVVFVYADNTAWLLLGVQSAAVLVRRMRTDGKTSPCLAGWFCAQLAIAGMYGPWVAFIRTQTGTVSRGGFSAIGLWDTLVLHFGATPVLWVLLLASVMALFAIRPPVQSRSVGSASCGHGYGLTRLRLSTDGRVWFLLCWWLLPTLALNALSYCVGMRQAARYTIASSLGLYLLAATGLAKLRPRIFCAAAAGAVLACSVSSLARYHSRNAKPQWREAVALIETHALPGDMLIFGVGNQTYKYYLEGRDLTVFNLLSPDPQKRTGQMQPLPADVRRVSQVFLILKTRGFRLKPERPLARLREERFSPVSEWRLCGLRVYRLVRQSGGED